MPRTGESDGGEEGGEEGRGGGARTRSLANWGCGSWGHRASSGSEASRAAAVILLAPRAQPAPGHSPAPEVSTGEACGLGPSVGPATAWVQCARLRTETGQPLLAAGAV